MRSDMAQVLVERPRLGARLKFGLRMHAFDRKTRCRDGADAPAKTMPMRFAPSRGLNENLMPLYRFLMRRRGRLWNDVYSELRSRLAPRSAIDMHVMQHLWDFVLFAREQPSGWLALVNDRGATRFELSPAGRLVGWASHRGVFYVSCESRLLFAGSGPKGRPGRL